MPSIQSFNGFSAAHFAKRTPVRFKGKEDHEAEYSKEYGALVKGKMDLIIQEAQGRPKHPTQRQAYESYCDQFHSLHQRVKAASQEEKKSLIEQVGALVRGTWDIMRKKPNDPSFNDSSS